MTKKDVIEKVNKSIMVFDKVEKKAAKYMNSILKKTLPKDRQYTEAELKKIIFYADEIFFDWFMHYDIHQETIEYILKNN